MSAHRPHRSKQRGSVSALFALVLSLFLVAFVALVVDLGHLWLVKGQLQNAADAAALAGARDLNGNSTMFSPAVLSAQSYARQHTSDGASVLLPDGDVKLGHWDSASRVFSWPESSPARVNAVQVTTRRNATTNGTVPTFFAPIFGVYERSVSATAVAIGGSPRVACSYPMAIPDCSIYDSAGNVACNQRLVFNGSSDNVSFTIFTNRAPSTQDMNCAFAQAASNPTPYPRCPRNCDCSRSCLSTPTGGGQVTLGNGNNLSSSMTDAVQWALDNATAAGKDGLYINMPVVRTGQTATYCAKAALSNSMEIIGYAQLKITSISGSANDKTIEASVVCSTTDPAPPTDGFFGLKSTYVYIAQ